MRDDLEQVVGALGSQVDVYVPAFVEIPFQYIARAVVLVLSSASGRLQGVHIQALPCGCPVVSTDCPGGSSEILEDGKYGALVSIGKADEMAKAVLAELDDPTPREILLRRAEDFSVERAVSSYLALLDAVVNQAADRK